VTRQGLTAFGGGWFALSRTGAQVSVPDNEFWWQLWLLTSRPGITAASQFTVVASARRAKARSMLAFWMTLSLRRQM
jgi:hypothetical protein